MLYIPLFKQAHDICNYVLCRGILRHASVNLFSCASYCEQYLCFMKFRRKNSIIFGILNQVNLHCGKQNFKLFTSNIDISNIYFSPNDSFNI